MVRHLGPVGDASDCLHCPHNCPYRIYDNRRHGEQWYYYLDPDAVFDLLTRTVSRQRH